MEQRIAEADERRMLNAIGKAEMIASANDSLDRSKVIADALMEEHVDKRFAKTAAAAFNKRITVNTLSRTPDAEKPAPFPISDPDMVFQLMGGEPGQLKTASVKGTPAPFSIQENLLPMQKAASVQQAEAQEIKPIPADVFELKLTSLLQKAAATITDTEFDIRTAETELDKARKEFRKAASCASPMDLQVVSNLYGKLLGDVGVDLPKPKGTLVSTGSALEKAASRVLEANSELHRAQNDKEECGEISGLLIDLSDRYMAEKKKDGGLSKIAAVIPWLGAALSTGVAVPGEVLGYARSALKNTSDVYTDLYNNAMAMQDAGRQLDESPNKVLTAEFINRDRYGDRLLNISDMLADKNLMAIAPRTKDIMDAANKAMDTDLSLERRDRSELLRAHVADLLLQGNKQNMANINALTGVTHNLKDSDKSTIAGRAKELASSMSSVSAPALIEKKKLTIPEPYRVSEGTANLAREMDAFREERRKLNEAKESSANSLFLKLLEERHTGDVQMLSDGTITVNGTPLDKEYVASLRRRAESMVDRLGSVAERIVDKNIELDKTKRKEETTRNSTLNSLVLDQVLRQNPDAVTVRRNGDSLELLDQTGTVLRAVDGTTLEGIRRGFADVYDTMGPNVAKDNMARLDKARKEDADRNSALNRLMLDTLYGQTPDAVRARRVSDRIDLLDASDNVVRSVPKADLDAINASLRSAASDFGMDEARRGVSAVNRATAAADAQARAQQNRAERAMRERVARVLNSPSFKSRVLTDAGVPHNLNNVGAMWQWRTTPNGGYELVPRDIDAQRVLLALGLPSNIQPSIPLNLSDAQVRNLL